MAEREDEEKGTEKKRSGRWSKGNWRDTKKKQEREITRRKGDGEKKRK